MNRKYQYIFFDLDNTLWDFEKNSKNAMLETFGQFIPKGSDFERFFEIYSKHNHNLWDQYRKKEIGKKELTSKRFLNTFEECGISGVDPDQMNHHYLEVMPNQKILCEGALEIVSYLQNKKYSMHIITNGFREVQLRKIESCGLKPFFGKIFISEDIKSPKPNHEIFELAVKSANAKKTASIMIGDDWDVDVMGAINFGMDAVFFDQKQESSNQIFVFPEHKNKVYKVGSFQNLKNIF